MSYLRILLTTITLVVLSHTYGQDPERKHSLGLYQSITDYNVSLLGNNVFAFDSAVSHSFRVAYQRRISRSWMLNTGISNGFILNQNIQESFVRKAYSMAADISILLKLNNGKIIKENARVAPFLSFGYRTDYVKILKNENESPWLFHNQYGAGLNIRLTNRIHFQTQVAIDQKLIGDFNTHMQYRFGLTHSLGKDKASAPSRDYNLDSDKDGIADINDKCPGRFGSEANGGCPDTTNYLVAALLNDKYANDSLMELLEIREREIAMLESADSGSMDSVQIKINQDKINKLLATIEKNRITSEFKIKLLENQLSAEENNTNTRVDTVYKTTIVYRESEGSNSDNIDDNLESERLAREAAERLLAEARRVRIEDSLNNINSQPIILEGKNYYVITMSSPNYSTSQNWLIKMQRDFSSAIIIPQPNGYYRVGIYAAKDRIKGLEILKQVKQMGYTQVWLSYE